MFDLAFCKSLCASRCSSTHTQARTERHGDRAMCSYVNRGITFQFSVLLLSYTSDSSSTSDSDSTIRPPCVPSQCTLQNTCIWLASISDLISFSVIVCTASPTLLLGRLSVTAKIVDATIELSNPPPPPPPKGIFKPSVAFLYIYKYRKKGKKK